MKNILIYLYKSNLKPVGGHHGYNYNLNCQLEKMGVENVHFIETEKGNYEGYKNGISEVKVRWIKTLLLIIKNFVRKGMLLWGGGHKAVVDLNQYDIVHFQSTYWMYACRDSLKKYKGKVVLTSHSPTLLSNEIIDSDLTDFEKKHIMWYYKHLIKMDEYSFNRADFIFFPCEEAEEPYYHAWNKFKGIRQNSRQKFKYLLSGIEPCHAKMSRSEVRRMYDIPEDAFVISYVGRHNEIKGYDLLKYIGSKLLESPNTYVLVAGKEEPLKRYAHDRWIEVGWTNDPHSLIAASDVFVLPNRETYFDLVMLEILSLGKIVVANKTGGNKYFERFNESGIKLFESVDECINILNKIAKMDNQQKEEWGKKNKFIFDSYFTSEVFAKNYLKLINSLD